jgi:hypothetical protein
MKPWNHVLVGLASFFDAAGITVPPESQKASSETQLLQEDEKKDVSEEKKADESEVKEDGKDDA